VDLDLFSSDDLSIFKKYGLAGASSPVPPPAPTPAPPAPSPSVGEYTVVAGDTLSGIASRYGTTWQALFAINHDRIADPNRIFVGQRIRVTGAVSSPAPSNQFSYYTVVRGDTLSGIAARFGTSWQQLFAWNRIAIGSNPNLIKPGQKLRVR
jgi:LysM repeat protein